MCQPLATSGNPLLLKGCASPSCAPLVPLMVWGSCLPHRFLPALPQHLQVQIFRAASPNLCPLCKVDRTTPELQFPAVLDCSLLAQRKGIEEELVRSKRTGPMVSVCFGQERMEQPGRTTACLELQPAQTREGDRWTLL